ncbi:MAG: CdaR family protein [Candidatus Dormibacteria bacterium]
MTRNLRLKVIALVGACAMWVGVVYASNPPQIATFDVVPQAGPLKGGLVLLHPLNPIPVKVGGIASNVRKRAVAHHLFAQVNLGHFTTPGEYQATVKVESSDSNVFIWSYPGKVPVVVDRETTRSLPLHVIVESPPPAGYNAATAATPNTVTVTGPQSVLAHLQAEVRVNLSQDRTTLTIPQQPVTLLNTEGVRRLAISPAQVNVVATITSETTERELPVHPLLAGQLPTGYQLVSLAPTPLTVTASGAASALVALSHIVTASIDVSHMTSSQSVTVALVAPSGVSLSTSYVTISLTIAPTATPTPAPTASPTP